MAAYLQVTLKHSGIARTQRQKDTLRGLGLRRLHQSRVLKDTPQIRGMIGKVLHLVSWQESKSAELASAEKVSTYTLGAVKTKSKAKPKAKVSAKKSSASKDTTEK